MVSRFRTAVAAVLVMGSSAAALSSRVAVADPGDAANASPLEQVVLQLPGTESPSRPADVAGNLSVEVPVLPDLHALRGLCTVFLRSEDQGRAGRDFQTLIGATGGSPGSTTSWCRTYLALHPRSKPEDG